jgi:hypothetical protein
VLYLLSLYRRFCRLSRKDIAVPIPAMIREYNASMGGVDLLDNMVAVYRIPYRIKKWWFPIYTWSLRYANPYFNIYFISFTVFCLLLLAFHLLLFLFLVSVLSMLGDCA